MTTDKTEGMTPEEMAKDIRDAIDATRMVIMHCFCETGLPYSQITGMALIELGVKYLARGDGGLGPASIIPSLERLPSLYKVERGDITVDQARAEMGPRTAGTVMV